tara:strand:+ start:6849 stop:7625 length:777 start_codon:yes stop_codon:yes gene_type:complete
MQITFATNATESLHAAALEEIGHLDQGTLLFLQTRKKGVERGRGAKLVYGDDLVQVLIWTGFSYQSLIERSQRKLDEMLKTGTPISTLTKAAHDHGDGGANVSDSSAAIQETQAWFSRVLADHKTKDGEDGAEEGPDSPWEPLRVNGVVVPMCRVYKGAARPGEPRAPIPGHIYVNGMKLGEKVIEAATNGRWKAASSHKTIAKDILRSMLPVGLYSQYTLDPGLTAHLVAGQNAGKAAVAAGLPVNPEAIRQLFKIA